MSATRELGWLVEISANKRNVYQQEVPSMC